MQGDGVTLGPPTCTSFGENGPWVATYPEDRPSVSVGGGLSGAFFVIVLLWAVTPTVIAGAVASSRGQSVGLAVVLGLLLGWIGLVIVWVFLKPGVVTEARTLVAHAVDGSQPAASVPQHRDTSARLAELNHLKAQGLITPDEYASRREAILGQI